MPALFGKNMKKNSSIIILPVAALVLLAAPLQPALAQTPTPVVQAVLFHSPFCSHCIYVITEFLPGVFEQYGGQLELLMVDVTQPEGGDLYREAVNALGYPGSSVPFLVVGDTWLVGDVDIPAQFPALVDSLFASGGSDWPDLPGLAAYMAAQSSTQSAALNPAPISPPVDTGTPGAASSTAIPSLAPTPEPTSLIPTEVPGSSLADKLARDPIGNSLAIVVLLGMLFAVGWAAWYLGMKPGFRLTGIAAWSILVLCIVGLGVAGYLSYVETFQVEAYCGVVGDCNTVQQSEYARLFGILPIGVLGLFGYVLIFAAWAVSQFAKGKWGDYASLAQLLLTTIATLFSMYLTFLEPFIIGATCLWCLSSAVISTILMLLSLPPGKLAWQRLAIKNP